MPNSCGKNCGTSRMHGYWYGALFVRSTYSLGQAKNWIVHGEFGAFKEGGTRWCQRYEPKRGQFHGEQCPGKVQSKEGIPKSVARPLFSHKDYSIPAVRVVCRVAAWSAHFHDLRVAFQH